MCINQIKPVGLSSSQASTVSSHWTERERKRGWVGERERERETETEKERETVQEGGCKVVEEWKNKGSGFTR